MIGGIDPRGAYLSSVELLTHGGTHLQRGPRLPEGLSHVGAVASNGGVLVAGGQGRHGVTSNVLRWDGDSSGWERMTPMRAARLEPAVVAVGDQVVVCGGDPDVSCETWDPSSGWRDGPALEGQGFLRIDAATVDVAGREFLVAGVDGAGVFVTHCFEGAAACIARTTELAALEEHSAVLSFAAHAGSLALIAGYADHGHFPLRSPTIIDRGHARRCPSYVEPRWRAAGTFLADDDLVVVGGGTALIERFAGCARDSSTHQSTKSLGDRYDHRVARTSLGVVVVGGSRFDHQSAETELFTPALPSVEILPNALFGASCRGVWK